MSRASRHSAPTAPTEATHGEIGGVWPRRPARELRKRNKLMRNRTLAPQWTVERQAASLRFNSVKLSVKLAKLRKKHYEGCTATFGRSTDMGSAAGHPLRAETSDKNHRRVVSQLGELTRNGW